METLLIIVLGSLAVWLTWRLVTLRKGIESITSALKNSDELPDLSKLPSSTRQDRLSRLTSAVCDSVAEAEMSKVLSDGKWRLLDFVLNQIEDCLFIVDEDQVIRYSNAAARELFPSDTQPVGAQLIEICFEHHIVETVSLAFQADAKMQDQFDLKNLNKTLLVEAEPVDPDLRIGRGAWVMIRDRTAALNVEQTRRDFVANASHELKTPLSIIKGYLEVMGEEEGKSMVQVMQKHTDRISRIVDDMLTISKLEGQDECQLLKKEAFDLGDCIFGIIEQLQPLIKMYESSIDVLLPESEDRQFVGDQFYFDQIFFNLIENALKQNPRPGLKILVQIRVLGRSGKVIIDVIDDGVGIPEADLSEVFKRFYRVEKHHSQTIKGTGLGLSIVKRAVEAHQGNVSVTSQPGQKTRFRISLPAPTIESAIKK